MQITSKFLIILLFVKAIAAAVDYCDSKMCMGGLTHIACKNKGSFASTCPADRNLVVLSLKDIQLILDVHNGLRNKIASGSVSGFKKASKMNALTWDQELANHAALNVRQCKMSHDQCRNTVKFKFVGQNIALRSKSSKFEDINTFINSTINAWYSEVKDAKQSQIDSCCGGSNFSKIGHFLQLIQDRATHVGCAVVRYTNGQWKTTLITCNYSYANFLNQKVYVTGNAASACPNGANKKFSALCK